MSNTGLKKIWRPYISGSVFCEFYVDQDDQKQGLYLEYYENGNLLKQCFFKDDKKHGKFNEYFSDKSLKESCTFKEGKKEGLCVKYTNFFDVRTTTPNYDYYKNGKIVRNEDEIRELIIIDRLSKNHL